MNRTLLILFVLMASVGGAQPGSAFPFPGGGPAGDRPGNPEFMVREGPERTGLVERPTPLSLAVDSMGLEPVKVLEGPDGRPVLYTAHITTPVCADGDCKLMEIRFYWTLLGDYFGFDRVPEAPLTKFEHEEFTYGDYLKLHQLLMDDNSILKRKKIEELVKKPEPVPGTDAVAGATIAEVKESVVEGALYSCYTAWHLVHGDISGAIKERTVAMRDDTLLQGMLHSPDRAYQMFALKQMDPQAYVRNAARIAEVFRTGIPLVRTYIIKNLPEAFWDSKELQAPFWAGFAQVDINSRSLLLQHLDTAPKETVADLATDLGVMTKNQIKEYLGFLGAGQELGPSLRKTLTDFAGSDQVYAYIVADFLQETPP